MTELTPTELLFSASMMNNLAGDEMHRKPIPPAELQSTLGLIGVAAGHDLPVIGEPATLRFSNGMERVVGVNDYSLGGVGVDIPIGDGTETVRSNIDLGAFEALTRDTRI